jgi:hypothetical protein
MQEAQLAMEVVQAFLAFVELRATQTNKRKPKLKLDFPASQEQLFLHVYRP